MPFSKSYPLFSDWLKAHPENTDYTRRIARYHYANPNGTLKEARGFHPPTKLYRTSKSVNGQIKLHETYSDVLIQAWSYSKDTLIEIDSRLEDKLLEVVADFVGYGKDDWWFSYTINSEQPFEVEMEKGLNNNWKCVVETHGKVTYKETGELDNL